MIGHKKYLEYKKFSDPIKWHFSKMQLDKNSDQINFAYLGLKNSWQIITFFKIKKSMEIKVSEPPANAPGSPN